MKQTETSGSTLGTGLMAAGAAVLALAFLWRLSYVISGAASVSSLIFFLMLTLVVAGPLLVGGWLLRRRAPLEIAENVGLAERRRVLEADASLRRALVREIEQVVQRLGDPDGAHARRLLTDVRDDLARPGYSSASLLEGAAGLTGDQLLSVRRYDDLLTAEVRRISDLAARDDRAAASGVIVTAELLSQHVAERETLLGRGRSAAPLRPQEMLEAGLAPRRRVDDPVTLNLEDAVSYEGVDYVVRGVLDYFGGGRRWRAYQLHDGKQERWLDVRAGGAQLTWLALLPEPIAVESDTFTHEGIEYRLADRGAAAVTIESAAGRQEGVLVDYRRLTAGNDVLTVEEWPDGQRALAGRIAAREDLDLWTKPAAAE